MLWQYCSSSCLSPPSLAPISMIPSFHWPLHVIETKYVFVSYEGAGLVSCDLDPVCLQVTKATIFPRPPYSLVYSVALYSYTNYLSGWTFSQLIE